MKAVSIMPLIKLVDFEPSVKAISAQIYGAIENIRLKDGGVMIVNRDGATNGMPQNPLASLVAGTMVYGPALIVGESDKGCYTDVPEAFMELLKLDIEAE